MIVTLSAAGGGATCPADFGGAGRTGGVSDSVTISARLSVMQPTTMEVAARGSVFGARTRNRPKSGMTRPITE